MEATETQYSKRWAALAILCISLLIIAIDSTVLNMSIPSISASLAVSTAQLMWIVDVYAVVFASLMLTTGTLGDRFGRKLVLTIGLVVFGLGSLGAAHAISGNMLIAFRVFQGIGGAMMMPCTLSIIVFIFRDHAERSRALAIWSGTFGIGAGVGPLVGGLLLNFFDWPSVFYLNIPVVLVGLIGGYFLIPESKDSAAPKLDIGGFLLSFAGILLAVYAIIKAGEVGWGTPGVLIPMLAGLLFIWGFIRWEMRTSSPMLPIYFFKNHSFSSGVVSMFLNRLFLQPVFPKRAGVFAVSCRHRHGASNRDSIYRHTQLRECRKKNWNEMDDCIGAAGFGNRDSAFHNNQQGRQHLSVIDSTHACDGYRHGQYHDPRHDFRNGLAATESIRCRLGRCGYIPERRQRFRIRRYWRNHESILSIGNHTAYPRPGITRTPV